MIKRAITIRSVVAGAGILVCCDAVVAQSAEILNVEPAAAARVVLDPKRTIRSNTPNTLFSYNVPHILFEKDLWDRRNARVKPKVLSELQRVPGSFYRYPGGLMANHFDWEKSALSLGSRLQKRAAGERNADYPLFGIGEYLKLVGDAKGMPWITLNLLGEGTLAKPVEYSSTRMASSNKRLAEYMMARTPNATARYYQLGNELERTHYQWSHSKYISRSRESINAILAVDSRARFVPFLREFNWKYRYPMSGVSKATDFVTDVLRGLPMVNDLSMNIYYDGRLKPTSRYVAVPAMLSRANKLLGMAKQARPGENFRLWVTEHSQRAYGVNGKAVSHTALGTGLSVGDFLLGLMQMPQVRGASVHGLQGTPRRMFYSDLQPTAALRTLQVLSKQPYPRVIASKSYSPNSSNYPGGYDVRAVGFTDATGAKLAVSAVNRATKAQALQINYPRFKAKAVALKHYYVAGSAGASAGSIERGYKLALNPAAVNKRFGDTGKLSVMLPPSSVSTLVFQNP
jgi:hypothetical protein